MTDEYDGDTLTAEAGPDGWDMVPTRLWLGGGIPVGADRVWIALMRRSKMSRDQATPRRTLIAADVGMGVRTVDGHLDALVRAGWLLITPRWRDGGNGQTSNHYAVLWNPIDSLDDPRLVAHLQAVAKFERDLAALAARKATAQGRPADAAMDRRDARKSAWSPDAALTRAERYAARITAGQTPRAESARGVAVGTSGREIGSSTPRRSCTGPVQDLHGPRAGSAPLESVPLESVPLESREPLSAGADETDSDPIGQLMILTVAAPTPPAPPSFEEFWAVYPRQVKRAPARARWDQVVKGGANPVAILAGAQRYAAWCQARGKAEEYIAHPQQWLKDGRWTDTIDTTAPGPLAGAKPAPSDVRLAEGMETIRMFAEAEAANPSSPDPMLARLEARSQSRRLAYAPLESTR